MPRARRLTGGDAIRELFRRGKRSKTANLDVFASASPSVRSRVALVVPKHGRSIVDRNRLKRRLREVARNEVLPRLDAAGASVDVLVRSRASAYALRFAELREELASWTDRHWPDAQRSR